MKKVTTKATKRIENIVEKTIEPRSKKDNKIVSKELKKLGLKK